MYSSTVGREGVCQFRRPGTRPAHPSRVSRRMKKSSRVPRRMKNIFAEHPVELQNILAETQTIEKISSICDMLGLEDGSVPPPPVTIRSKVRAEYLAAAVAMVE